MKGDRRRFCDRARLLDRVAVSLGCCLDSRFVLGVSVVEFLQGVRFLCRRLYSLFAQG